MMMRNEDSAVINIDDFGSSRLLHDIEEISKALYLRESPPKISIPPKNVKDNLFRNDKKPSIWKWKPLKALTHIRNHRLSCSFFLHIHSIEGLPLNLNGLSLCVYWKRKHEVLKSHSICVKEGVAEFEETLIHRCSVYVTKRDPHNDVAKYAPKLSLLYVSIVGAPKLDIGKHWIDLTSLLPVTLMELEDEKNRYGKWITSFKLTGKAKGGTINVSIGFSLSGDNFMRLESNVGKSHNVMLQRVRSIPSNSSRRTHRSSLSFDIKDRNGIEGEPSIGVLYELLDDAKTSYSKELNSTSDEGYDGDFTVVDKGIEFPKCVESSDIETIDVTKLFDDVKTENVFDDISCKESINVCTEESNEELELILENLLISESQELDFEDDCHLKDGVFCDGAKMVKSRSLDDITSVVIDDFMNLVGFDSDPESPRESLLKQFENETLSSGNFLFDLDVKQEQGDCSNILDSSLLFQQVETKHDYEVGPSLISRRKANMLENLETESLMEKWGFNERLFQNSPRTDSGAFGSPVYLSPERPCQLPPLANGLGPFLKTENGGFLRSMNPLLFQRAKNSDKLVMQVSNTVLLPPAMGSTNMDIMINWATMGPEKILFMANSLMPIEVITGKTLQQAAWKAESDTDVLRREHTLLHSLHEPESKEIPTGHSYRIDSEYVHVDALIPLAIEKIQYLLIEGLRIQSGISNEDPPSTINSTITSNGEVEELINMSISFAEWKKLDSANLDVRYEVSDRFSQIFGESFDQNHGYFGNFTLALQILLRDPLRDYEPVGIPMLALVQVERSTSVDSLFKVNEVHLNGFKADVEKKQKSGFRWLYSSGMSGKRKTHPVSKSTALVKSSIRSMNKMKHEEILWSISSYVHGEVAKWKESSGLGLYSRNPDIVFK